MRYTNSHCKPPFEFGSEFAKFGQSYLVSHIFVADFGAFADLDLFRETADGAWSRWRSTWDGGAQPRPLLRKISN